MFIFPSRYVQYCNVSREDRRDSVCLRTTGIIGMCRKVGTKRGQHR